MKHTVKALTIPVPEPLAIPPARRHGAHQYPAARRSPPACDTAVVTALRTNWAILDRTTEMGLIDVALRTGLGVVISGPTGVGKTTLLEAVRARFDDDDGHAVVRAIGSASLARIPLAAFARFGRDSADGMHGLLASIWRSLERHAEGKRLVVVLDDAHQLDDASAALVYQLAAFGGASVIAAIRSGEPTPEPIHALWKDRHCERVELRSLRRSDVERVITSALGGRVEGSTAHELWRVTGGNVLFLRELVRSGLESGALRKHDHLWAWDGTLKPTERLHELVSSRLDGLKPEERTALELIALAEPVDFELVTALSSPETVEALEARQLVKLSLDEQGAILRTGHPLFGEVLRSTLTASTTLRLRQQLADRLETRGLRHRSDALRLATWRLELGDRSDPALLLEAANWFATADLATAQQLARRALADGAGVAGEVLLAHLVAAAGYPQEAQSQLAAAHAIDPAAAEAIAIARSEIQLCDFGDVPGAEELLLSCGIAEGHESAVDVDAFQLRLGAFGASQGDLATRAGALTADPATGSSARAWAEVAHVESLLRSGKSTAAATATVRGCYPRRDTMSIDGSLSAAQAAAAGRIASAWAYGLDQAIQSAHEDYEHTITRGAVGHGLTALVLGELQLLVGVAEESIWSLREASITLRRAQPYLGRCLDGLAVALSLCGELDQAREVLKQRAAIVGPPADDLGAARAAAAVAAAGGDVGHALGILQDAGTQAARNRAHLEAVRIAHDLARIGDLRTARHLVTDEGTHVDGTVATLLCEHVLALCGRRPHPLQSVASQLAEAGLWRFAAEAELAAAERFANEGQRAAAGAASRRASALMGSCGPLHLGVEAPIPGQVGLTRREREIAELAAAGLRDLEISERLSVSVRTVQTHLQHAYCKLGVHSREALQAALSSTRPARRT